MIEFGVELYNQQDKLLAPFNPTRLRILKDYINNLQLVDSNLDDTFTKIKQLREQYHTLENTEDDNLVKNVIDPKYKEILNVPSDESYELIKKILDQQCKYFIRFMNATAMGRSKLLSFQKDGWHLYLNMLKT